MENFDRKKHWENIYQTKELQEVSWFQPTPETSLYFFKQFSVPAITKVIDIGGGDSFLVDHLLDLGYQDISVLDISASAINRAKHRLGDKAKNVKWIEADVTTFVPIEKYDFWHDRAAFHFLTDEQEISNYVETARQNINPQGVLVIGTFSDQGPKKCSGIEIKQYTETTLTRRFNKFFEKSECITVDHKTPFNTMQNFVFCCFRKLQVG
ncbi:MAG: class I SAM-dependent methyltransferase [Saprospiraceae bacterium]|nr:class I SAM-dependent methyltransferase [Saprospiraceae bacterium]MBK7522869.1 class I SAM-dependent methyltransferase [Saprospiraceae bacterium]MBK8854374.1 class I SAM-dependent methyltransferase [Saprospiraceae bacterium]MBP6694955.1 class I SAM-dependent methyltransferase [Saprospiraceae bacterium]